MIDYYEILKVPFHSDNSRIKRAYYRLAKIWHPDKNCDSAAASKFHEISLAYKTLSDKNLRMSYDFQLIIQDSRNYLYTDSKIPKKPHDFGNSKENLDFLYELLSKNTFQESKKVGSKRFRDF